MKILKLLCNKAILTGLLVGVISMILTVAISLATNPDIVIAAAHSRLPLQQETGEPQPITDEQCKECHLDISTEWTASPHANAYADPVFQERWSGLGKPGDCLVCHTTNFQASTNSYHVEGVSCEACHGQVETNHPPAVVQARGDAEFCGTCHTTTLHEWRLTAHSTAGIGCTACHNPHNQKALFDNPDQLCINCHSEDMERYLEDIHIQKDIGCVDCHALVIPPDPVPVDGIVPTGHTFTITPATCVACHTDALHAGFSLPGFEQSATNTEGEPASATPAAGDDLLENKYAQTTSGLTAEQRLQALEASIASQQLSTLFQGGVIGLVLGGTTAWFMASNARRSRPRKIDQVEEDNDNNGTSED